MRRGWARFASSGLLIGAVSASCRDIEPVRGRLVQASADAGGSFACAECVLPDTEAGGPCALELGVCRADPGCGALLQCLRDAGCFDAQGDEARNRCALPCALALGVTSAEEARVLLVTDIATCGARECSDVCR